ncbi:MAG TPA: hypothetical protein VD978_02450 [Azospirillum sp.]|nr:hypothetical protein [Azospirillum sp.]
MVSYNHVKKHGVYRSGFEKRIADALKEAGVKVAHEPGCIPYKNDTGGHCYVPDFKVRLKDGAEVYLEAKGFLDLEASYKMRAVKLQNPNVPIWFVFENGNGKVGRRKSTNQAWAKRYGFPAAHKTIPQEWLDQFMTEADWTAFQAKLKAANDSARPGPVLVPATSSQDAPCSLEGDNATPGPSR